MDIAVAGCGVSGTMDGNQCVEARVPLGAVAPTALLVPEAAAALVGTGLDEAALAAAGEACTNASLQSQIKEEPQNTEERVRYFAAEQQR